MARQKKVTINGQEYTLQSVSPTWYYDINDKYGMTGSGRKKTIKYMDELFKNCVIAPVDITNQGVEYFEQVDDFKSMEELVAEIESFLRD